MEKFNELLSQYKLPLALSFVGLVLILGGIISSNLASPPKGFPKESLKEQGKSEIKVDISGAVVNPGVYGLGSGSRVEDGVNIAGGFDESANQTYISKTLNLSAKLSDGMKIYIPFEGEQGVVQSQVAGVQTSAKIGLNSGTDSQLDTLPGIGPVTASKIISNRPYSEVIELLTKKVVSKSVYERIKDLVDVN